jgi:spore coat polysaccharide biosynthesis protein SpsF
LIGIVILSRFNSSRLPGKALRLLHGKPLLGHIVERLRTGLPDVPITLATSTEATDNPIEDFARQYHIRCYRGSLNNVAERFLMAAESSGFDYAVRITGDSLFIDPALVETLIAQVHAGNYDFVSNRKFQQYPIGQSVEIVRTAFYRRYFPAFSEPGDFEHVTEYFHKHADNIEMNAYHHHNPDGTFRAVSLAIDTPEDFALAARAMQVLQHKFSACAYRDVYQLYLKLKGEDGTC